MIVANVVHTTLEICFILFVVDVIMVTFGIVIYSFAKIATLNVLLAKEKQLIVLNVWMDLTLFLTVINVVL